MRCNTGLPRKGRHSTWSCGATFYAQKLIWQHGVPRINGRGHGPMTMSRTPCEAASHHIWRKRQMNKQTLRANCHPKRPGGKGLGPTPDVANTGKVCAYLDSDPKSVKETRSGQCGFSRADDRQSPGNVVMSYNLGDQGRPVQCNAKQSVSPNSADAPDRRFKDCR